MIRRLFAWLFGASTLTTDPTCAECAGSGFDMGGQRCACVTDRRDDARG